MVSDTCRLGSTDGGGGGTAQEEGVTPHNPQCVGSNWREMGSFWAWKDVNGVPLYGYILGVLHLYEGVFRKFTHNGCIFRGVTAI